jgi:hypothetical protein
MKDDEFIKMKLNEGKDATIVSLSKEKLDFISELVKDVEIEDESDMDYFRKNLQRALKMPPDKKEDNE